MPNEGWPNADRVGRMQQEAGAKYYETHTIVLGRVDQDPEPRAAIEANARAEYLRQVQSHGEHGMVTFTNQIWIKDLWQPTVCLKTCGWIAQ